MIKKYLSILILIFFQINISSAEAYEEDKEYAIYTGNVNDICKNQDYSNGGKAYKTEDFYLKAKDYKQNPSFGTYFTNTSELFPLDGVERIYRDTQNNIYKCGMYGVQIKSYERVKKAILRENTGLLKNRVENTINSKIKFLEDKINKYNCRVDEKTVLSKQQILKQSTYELCNYIFYLDYLQNRYYNNIENITGLNSKNIEGIQKDANTGEKDASMQTILITKKIETIKNSINIEKQHSYDMYNMAFVAFSEYDSFLPIHIMLEIIKQDFIILRDTLYSEISPINQVGYKIINAMSK